MRTDFSANFLSMIALGDGAKPRLLLEIDRNLVNNPGFESGDFTGWLIQSAAIDSTTVHDGIYSAKLVASGSDITGPISDHILIDVDLLYQYSAWFNVTAISKGGAYPQIMYYSNAAGTVACSPKAYESFPGYTETTGGWVNMQKTIGPGGDLTPPADCVAIRLRLQWWDAAHDPTGTIYQDDFVFGLYPAPLRYSNQSFSVGGQAYLPQVLEFGRIQDNRIRIRLSNIPRTDNLIKAGQDVNIYLWDTSLDAAEKGIIFSGVVSDDIGGNKYELSFTCSSVSDKFDKMVGTLLNDTVNPGADPDYYNKMLPIILGTVRNVECFPVSAGMLTTLVSDISESAETIEITEYFRGGIVLAFPGTVIIGNEEISFTSIDDVATPTQLTGCTRGANGTTAVSHYAGDAIIEKVANLVYKVAEHDLYSITKPRILPIGSSDDRTVELSPADYSIDTVNGEIILTNVAGIRRQVQLAVTVQPNQPITTLPVVTVTTPHTHTISAVTQKVLRPTGFTDGQAKWTNETNAWDFNSDTKADCDTVGAQSSTLDLDIPTDDLGTIQEARLFLTYLSAADTTRKVTVDGVDWTLPSSATKITVGHIFSVTDWADLDTTDLAFEHSLGGRIAQLYEIWWEIDYTPVNDATALASPLTTPTASNRITDVVIGGNTVADTLGGPLIVNVQGKPDDGSGTYTGTPNALIEKPSHAFHWLLITYGNNVTAGDIDLTGSFQDCLDNLPASYRFSIYLRKRLKLNNLLRALAIQVFCRFEWSVIAKAELIRRRTSGAVVRSLNTDEAMLPGNINQKNKEELITFNKPSLVDIANDVEVLYYQNPVLGDESDPDTYEGQSQDDDATSQGDYGLRKKTWLMSAIGDNATMAADVRDKLLAYYKDGHQANSLPFDMSQLELESGDLLGLTCDDLGISASQHDIIQINYDLPSLLKKQDLVCWINALDLNIAV